LCGQADLFPVLHRERTMVSANLLYDTPAEARAAPTGELRIVLCRTCGFVFNAAFDLARVPYGARYDNDQSRSEHFADHMHAMAVRIRAALDGRPLRAVEIGCGQGQFLSLVLSLDPTSEDRAAGFDPSYGGEPIAGCTFHLTFFDDESARQLDFRPNAVISRHVIEHVPDPNGLLRAVFAVLDSDASSVAFFETPSIDWVFEHDAFWDLCYEHCSYFAPGSARFAFESAGFGQCVVRPAFGGQYMWIEGSHGTRRHAEPPATEDLARGFVARVAELQTRWHDRLVEIGSTGKVAVWGGATKGARFVQDVDGDATLVHCMIDINPRKQGRYLPLTGHRVMAWEAALADGVSTIVVSNPNYLAEIRDLVVPHAPGMTFLTL